MHGIQLYIGSVTGTADYAAETLANKLITNGYDVTTEFNPTTKSLTKPSPQLLLIITSTTGHGDLPGNLQLLWQQLNSKQPRLTGLNYAVAVLGDSSYADSYCMGGIQLDSLLQQLGAQQQQQPLLIDAEETNYPEEEIVAWGSLLTSRLYKDKAA